MYTAIMELASQSHNKDGLLGLNSIIVVCIDPLGKRLRSALLGGSWVVNYNWGFKRGNYSSNPY